MRIANPIPTLLYLAPQPAETLFISVPPRHGAARIWKRRPNAGQDGLERVLGFSPKVTSEPRSYHLSCGVRNLQWELDAVLN